MALVATLIVNPSNPILDRRTVDRLARAVDAEDVRILAENVASDLFIGSNEDPAKIEKTLRAAIADDPVDIVVQPDGERRKAALLADMDSTMIGQECIDELAAEVGLKERIAEITRRAMNGEIAFEPALRERVGLLKGLPASVIAKVLETRITLAPGGRELVATMRANGAHTALVSGGFTAFTSAVAERIGFHEHHANTLVELDGVLTGTVGEPILGRQAKVDTLNAIAQRLGLSTRQVLAVGDGANDLGMLQLAGTGVALHAKPSVAAAAGVRIDHADLTALLYLQGYSRDTFIQ